MALVAQSSNWTLSRNKNNNDKINNNNHSTLTGREQCKSRQDISKSPEKKLRLTSEAESLRYVKLLQACGKAGRVSQGRKLHAEIVKLGLDDNFLSSHIAQMYLTCGCLDEGKQLFTRMRRRNVVLWTSLIKAYAQFGHYKEALELFEQMKSEVIPDKITFITVLGACGNWKALEEGRDVHLQVMKRGFESDTIVQSALVHMYGKAGSLEDAQLVFEKMAEKDVVTWTAIISGHAEQGQCNRALELYDCMQRQGVAPNKFTYVSVLSACVRLANLSEGRNTHERILSERLETDTMVGTALVNMYGKCGRLTEAEQVFSSLKNRDAVSWGSMIRTYSNHEMYREALKLFREMQLSGTHPNVITLSIVFGACASLGVSGEGSKIHSLLEENGFGKDVILETALVDMYGRSGRLREARKVFDEIPEPKVSSWNAIISAYAEQEPGGNRNALRILFRMQQRGVKPDVNTLASVLAACSRGGEVELGCQLYGAMLQDYGGVPTWKHYCFMVELLGRAGYLDEAERFTERVLQLQLQSSGKIISGLWMTLLYACRAHGDLERARRVSREVISLEPLQAGVYLVLLSMHAGVGRWDVVDRIRKFMLEKGVEEEAGRSTIEVKNRLHEFGTAPQGCEHPRLREVHAEVERLIERIKREGYVAETWREEEMVKLHSEKLAVAFGVMSTPFGSPVRIITSGRVCSDCHSATKLISKVKEREIFLRDARCLHVFENGRCSCGDYW